MFMFIVAYNVVFNLSLLVFLDKREGEFAFVIVTAMYIYIVVDT